MITEGFILFYLGCLFVYLVAFAVYSIACFYHLALKSQLTPLQRIVWSASIAIFGFTALFYGLYEGKRARWLKISTILLLAFTFFLVAVGFYIWSSAPENIKNLLEQVEQGQ